MQHDGKWAKNALDSGLAHVTVSFFHQNGPSKCESNTHHTDGKKYLNDVRESNLWNYRELASLEEPSVPDSLFSRDIQDGQQVDKNKSLANGCDKFEYWVGLERDRKRSARSPCS